MAEPLVTVICLCYNHERFVKEALESVLNQSYKSLQIIVVDDASTDNSVQVINEVIHTHPNIRFLPLKTNMGICKAFNQGLAQAKGDFIIDFATDDVMMPDKINKQVEYFGRLDKSYGVVFTDALYIDSDGNPIRQHFEYLKNKGFLTDIPEGNIYEDVISTYFIPSPSMMVRKEVFKLLNGYDEELVYEDFDFWVRSSRFFKYAFMNEITIKIRKSDKSLSRGQYRKGDKQLHSTYLVCKKIFDMNEDALEDRALARRLKFEIRQSVFSQNHHEAKLFHKMLTQIGYKNILTDLLITINRFRLPLSIFRSAYHRVRYGKNL